MNDLRGMAQKSLMAIGQTLQVQWRERRMVDEALSPMPMAPILRT
jgi:hypothetical protein